MHNISFPGCCISTQLDGPSVYGIKDTLRNGTQSGTTVLYIWISVGAAGPIIYAATRRMNRLLYQGGLPMTAILDLMYFTGSLLKCT